MSNSTETIPAGSSASNISKLVIAGLISIAKPPIVVSVKSFVYKLLTVGSATLSGILPLTITDTLTLNSHVILLKIVSVSLDYH